MLGAALSDAKWSQSNPLRISLEIVHALQMCFLGLEFDEVRFVLNRHGFEVWPEIENPILSIRNIYLGAIPLRRRGKASSASPRGKTGE
jgi:hypothetical protein